jgi:hypothetical protein
VSMKTFSGTPISSHRGSTSRSSWRRAFTTPRVHAPDTRRPEWVRSSELSAESPTGADGSTGGTELQAYRVRRQSRWRVGCLLLSSRVSGARLGSRSSFGTRRAPAGRNVGQRMSPPSHPESGETTFPEDGARLDLPHSREPVTRSRSAEVDRLRFFWP